VWKGTRKGCALKSSGNSILQGLLGLLLLGWGLSCLAHRTVKESDLEAALRLGYARPAGQLSKSSALDSNAGLELGWLAPLDRALKIQLSAADRLRVDFPQEQDLILLETDVQPMARYGLEKKGAGFEIDVKPYRSAAWSAASNSGAAVLPAAYPANGRIAYYDLGRIWISDLDGLRMQSLQHVPLLENGGQLFWDYAGTRLCWLGAVSGAAAVDLTIEEEQVGRP
jgi:hypothetical protein